MELRTWASDFGLASWHPQCLAAQAYAQFVGAPVTVKASANPLGSSTWDWPVLTVKGQPDSTAADFESFVNVLERNRFSSDYALNSKQKSEAVALKTLAKDGLAPALAFSVWIDPRNLSELTRPWFAKNLIFPLGLILPRLYHDRAVALVESATGLDADSHSDLEWQQIAEAALARRMEECLRVLNTRLGDQSYFFGKSPTSVDAVVYSLIAPLIKAPLPNTRFANLAKSFPELVGFTSRISVNYFPRLVSSSSNPPAEIKSWNKHGLLAGVVAVAAMTGYAYLSGLARLVQSSLARS